MSVLNNYYTAIEEKTRLFNIQLETAKDNDLLKKEIVLLNEKINKIANSRSWKITKPLRWCNSKISYIKTKIHKK